jgi:hypothetical protein
MTAAERHNRAVMPILRAVVDAADGDDSALIVLAESLVVGIFLLTFKLGGEAPTIEVFTQRVKTRLAEQRLVDQRQDRPN